MFPEFPALRDVIVIRLSGGLAGEGKFIPDGPSEKQCPSLDNNDKPYAFMYGNFT